ncbi:MAG: P1 family peptidase [Gemmatimonadetes bacterium]|nr:P1 family peptidase [Gemmatimonadota bacterium]
MRCSVVLALSFLAPAALAQGPRPRARDIGLVIGVLPAGPLDAITDVAGVRVGQVTVTSGDSINTGITAILPHGGDVFREKVPAAVSVGNGFGKLTGLAQVRELGELESPIVLTCTLCVPRAADAVLTWVLGLPGNEDVRSVNVVVGETNDGWLNAIRRRPVTEAHVLEALRAAREGPVEEGSVGAGRGTVAFGWKGGIGTASRRLPATLGGWTVGVLVQTNFGGVLTIGGAPVGRRLGRYYLRDEIGAGGSGAGPSAGAPGADGSIMIVVATDAPLDGRQLERLAQRAFLGVGRTGSPMTNGSGDFAIAFSTAASARLGPLGAGQRTRQAEVVANDALSPLFEAVVEATEEAIVNSLFRAVPVRGPRGTVPALPIDSVVTVLREHRIIP